MQQKHVQEIKEDFRDVKDKMATKTTVLVNLL